MPYSQSHNSLNNVNKIKCLHGNTICNNLVKKCLAIQFWRYLHCSRYHFQIFTMFMISRYKKKGRFKYKMKTKMVHWVCTVNLY